MKIRAYVEETYQHLMEFDVPDEEYQYFDYQDEVRKAYEDGRAIPGKGRLVYMQVSDENTNGDWKEIWPNYGKKIKLPVVKVPSKAPVRRQMVRRLMVTAPSNYTDLDIDLELSTRLLSADGGHHLETMNWGPDEKVKIRLMKN